MESAGRSGPVGSASDSAASPASYARNLDDGRVEVYAAGPLDRLSDLAAALRKGHKPRKGASGSTICISNCGTTDPENPVTGRGGRAHKGQKKKRPFTPAELKAR